MKNGKIEFETIKSHKNRLYFLCGFVCVVALLVVFIVSRSHAKYRVTESIPLVNGTINYTVPDFNAVAIYINGDSGYTKSDTIPESGYVLNESESYCTINGEKNDNISLSYNTDTKSLSVSPMTTKGTKCYLYFDEAHLLADTIKSYNQSTRTDFSTTFTTSTTNMIFTAEDDDGTTYYFAGASTDNWVYFAGFYWRIIRVNGDGSIRLIYNGTSNVTTGTGTQISTSAFNSSNDNAYVGYMYTLNEVHGMGTDSEIKTTLDSWYSSNLSSYASYIDTNAGFCNDRYPSTSSSSSNGSGGTGTTLTYYAAYIRLTTNKAPSFKCQTSSDLFTVSGSSKGNKSLTYPIGLITADEVAYAGGVYNMPNTNYYLYTGQYYWTISPRWFSVVDESCHIFNVGSYGDLFTANSSGVRPVINLKADTAILSGDGSANSPYVIS